MSIADQCVTRLLSLETSVEPIRGSILRAFPTGVATNCAFYATGLLKRSMILLCDTSDSTCAPKRVQGRGRLIRQGTRYPMVFMLHAITTCGMQHLIERHMGFVVPRGRVFVPSLLVSLGPRGGGVKNNRRARVPTVTRYVVLCRLRMGSLRKGKACSVTSLFGISCTGMGQTIE